MVAWDLWRRSLEKPDIAQGKPTEYVDAKTTPQETAPRPRTDAEYLAETDQVEKDELAPISPPKIEIAEEKDWATENIKALEFVRELMHEGWIGPYNEDEEADQVEKDEPAPTTQKVEEARVVVTGRMSTEDFVIRVLIVAAAVAGFYYFFSPYQNCLRDTGYTQYTCTARTSW